MEAASPASKPTKIETPEKKPEVPAQAPRLPQTVKTNENGVKSTAAFGKEQIDNIEKEMFRTYMSNESEEFSDSEEADESLQELVNNFYIKKGLHKSILLVSLKIDKNN